MCKKKYMHSYSNLISYSGVMFSRKTIKFPQQVSVLLKCVCITLHLCRFHINHVFHDFGFFLRLRAASSNTDDNSLNHSQPPRMGHNYIVIQTHAKK